MSWATKVHFVYVFADGSESPHCWRLEYDSEEQRMNHESLKA
jgi:hypothetical protein